MWNRTRKARSSVAGAVCALLLAALGLSWGASALAQSAQSGCSNRTLRGDYAVKFDGQLLSGPITGTLRGVAMARFDGDGHSTQVNFATINGAPLGSDWSPGTGTYNVSPDCTGEATLNLEFGPPVELRFVVADKGKTFHNIELGNATGSTGTRVN